MADQVQYSTAVRCAKCGRVMDVLPACQGGPAPVEGEIVIDAQCGGLMFFTVAPPGTRLPTVAEFRDLMLSPKWEEIQRVGDVLIQMQLQQAQLQRARNN